MLDLLAADPVRRRFGFADNDLETITGWVEQAGVRWAFDEQHRAPYGLDGYVQNTWRFGLDRVLAGVAMSDDAGRRLAIGTTLPLDDVGSAPASTSPAGSPSCLDRLQRGHRPARPAATPSTTGSTPSARASTRSPTVARGDEWQTGQVQRELTALAGDAAAPAAPSSCGSPTCAR